MPCRRQIRASVAAATRQASTVRPARRMRTHVGSFVASCPDASDS